MFAVLPAMPTETDTIELATASPHSAISAAITSAAYAPCDDVGWIRVTGEDRVRWLNGMVTNSVQSLGPGEGCYNFFLNAQGRIQGDATAWLLEDCILLETANDRVPALIALLDRFIIMDDVELQPLDARAGLVLAGPASAEVLGRLGLPVREPEALRLARTSFNGSPIELIHAYSPLVPRFEVWGAPDTVAVLAQALCDAGISRTDAGALNQLRLLEGTPVYGVDIRDRDLPQETAQARALHFAKGCYLGQEIVERIRSRGNVHRTLSGFLLSGSIPAAGTPLFAAENPEKSVGELTSAAWIDLAGGPVILALGYIRREALERGNAFHYTGGTAVPTTLPYRLPSTY